MQGKALQAKERLLLLEGWRATTTRFGAVMMMMINGAPNSHSTPVEPLQTLLLKERLLEGCRKGGWVFFGGLAMVTVKGLIDFGLVPYFVNGVFRDFRKK